MNRLTYFLIVIQIKVYGHIAVAKSILTYVLMGGGVILSSLLKIYSHSQNWIFSGVSVDTPVI